MARSDLMVLGQPGKDLDLIKESPFCVKIPTGPGAPDCQASANGGFEPKIENLGKEAPDQPSSTKRGSRA